MARQILTRMFFLGKLKGPVWHNYSLSLVPSWQLGCSMGFPLYQPASEKMTAEFLLHTSDLSAVSRHSTPSSRELQMCKTSWLALSPPLRLIFIYSSLGDVLKHMESLGNLSPSRLHVAKSSRSCTPTTSRTCLRRLKADQRKKVF